MTHFFARVEDVCLIRQISVVVEMKHRVTLGNMRLEVVREVIDLGSLTNMTEWIFINVFLSVTANYSERDLFNYLNRLPKTAGQPIFLLDGFLQPITYLNINGMISRRPGRSCSSVGIDWNM